MEKLFSKGKYISRRSSLKKAIGSGVILISGNQKVPMNYPGNTYPFRQDSNFLYFFGLDTPDLYGIIDVDADEEIIFGPEYSVDDLIWSGQIERLEQRVLKTGVKKTLPCSKFDLYIKGIVNSKRKLHFLPPYHSEKIIQLSRLLDIQVSKVIENSSLELVKAVINLRSFKDDDEIKQIEYALNNITYDIYINIMSVAREGVKEYELVAIADKIAISRDCRLAYPVICSVNGQYLHNETYDNTLKNGQLLLIDAGSESPLHYASDITRTIPVSGKFNSKQSSIYQLVVDMADNAIKMMKPGIQFNLVHRKASETLAAGMISLGLMRGSAEEIVEAGAHALFFPHGLGHLMGLDVHDMEDLGECYTGYNETCKRSCQFGTKFLRYAKELQQGTVITVEPGIYFIPELIDSWRNDKKFMKYIDYEEVDRFRYFGGLRVEDNVLITSNSNKILGKHIPRTIREVEAACGLSGS